MCDVVQFTLGPSDYAAWFRYSINSSRKVAWSRGCGIAVCVGLAFLPFALDAWLYHDAPFESGFGPYRIIMAIAIAAGIIWQVFRWSSHPERLVAKAIKDGSARGWFEPQEIRLSQEYLTCSAYDGISNLRWHAVAVIDETPAHLFVRIGDNALIIPTTRFPSDAARREFISLARQYRQQAPSVMAKCPGCGYELKGVLVDGCPECGWRREASDTPSP